MYQTGGNWVFKSSGPPGPNDKNPALTSNLHFTLHTSQYQNFK